VFLIIPSSDSPLERIDYRDLSVRHLGSLYEGMIEYQLFIAEEDLLVRREKSGRVKYLSVNENNPHPTDELINAGKVYFAQNSSERIASGTHYTPEVLVAELVDQTLGRIINVRWDNFESEFHEILIHVDACPPGKEQNRFQDLADKKLEDFIENQILSLRICDPALGIGHFLVYFAN